MFECFVPRLVAILAYWFWGRSFQCIVNISISSFLGEGNDPSLEQGPSTQGCFVPSLVEIGSVVLMKKLTM